MSDQMLHGKRFRPLMPRPTISNTDFMFSSTPDPSFLNFCNSKPTNFSAWNFHPSDARIHQKNEMELLTKNGEALLVGSPRWNPTPEQIETLEEIYKTGLRTPSADQIQKIASKLRKFGKIEGKNVFYWFQNHKARERQKRRRLAGMKDNNIGTNLGLNDPGEVDKKVINVEAGEKWSAYSRCSFMSKDCASVNRAVMAESRRNGWEEELQQQTRESKRMKKATFQMDMSPCPNIYYIFSTTISPQQSPKQSCDQTNVEKVAERGTGILELFPLGGNTPTHVTAKEEESGVFPPNYATTRPRQFFEFLPLKS